MDLGSLVVKLRADLTNFARNLQRARESIRTFERDVERRMVAAARHIRSFSVGVMSRMYASIRRYARLAALALAGIGVATVKMAADVRESMNFFRESFKGATAEAKKWADEFGRALFVNRNKVREYMVTFNEMLQGMGLGQDQAVQMSKSFVKMTYDLASFRNLRLEEAFGKIQSALVGMSRPMRDLGYDISETAIAEEALAMGITKSVENMTQAEKVMLRYARMTRLLANAHGDMQRTLNEAANVFRGIWEQVIEIGQKVGEVLLKRIHPAAITLRDFLAQNQEKIVVYFDVIITNLTNIAKYIAGDFGASMRLAGTIILETLKGVFESLLIVAKHTFMTIGRLSPGWIAEGMKAGASAAMEAAGTKAAQEGKLGLFGFAGALGKGIAQEREIRRRAIEQYAKEFPGREMTAGTYGEFYKRWQRQKAAAAKEGREVEPTWRIMQIAEEIRAGMGGKGVAPGEAAGGEIAQVWQERMANIQAALKKAQESGGLEIVTAEQIEALHAAEAEMENLNDQLLKTKENVEGIKPAMSEAAARWKSMWEDASAGIAGAMQTAFSNIISNAKDAKQYAVDMLKSIQTAISDAIFRQYILQNLFKMLNLIPGISGLTVPAAQATATQAGAFQATGMSRGGIVYARRGLFVPKGTDTVPIMATPGEGVLDKDTTARLRRILEIPEPMMQGGGQPLQIHIHALDAAGVYRVFSKNRGAFATMMGLNKQVNHAAARG